MHISRRTLIGGAAAAMMAGASRAADRPARPALTDIHAHVTSRDTVAYPPAPLDGTVAAGAFDDPLTIERLIAGMDAGGVARALVVQRAHVYGFDNRYVLDSARRHPDRLRALCAVDAERDASGAAVRALMRHPGVVGIRMSSPAGRQDVDWFAGANALRAWDAAIDAGGTIRLHMYTWNRSRALARLAEILPRYREAEVVIDHIAGSEVEKGAPGYGIDAALLALARFANVSIMFSMINQRRLATVSAPVAPLVSRLVAEFGSERVLWGSDVGNTPGPYAAMIAWAEDAVSGLRPADRVRVLGANADALYFAR